ncbi:hypothetical protein P9G84_13780 [Brevibacillus centrosporus]|uniref:hypothetical protein n=1 Tax=Brevibacillus centrosporus TaxID=54910 RepID=UPI001144BF3D|nr:hypothetical protein [Brevibacillus centrosporus]MEC2130013.1 hypothetical protein [Brevibacillus centrosporus]GED32393.1 hypothetical protein BCE02nite_35340 [Brevibacillus centrosporus]
MDAILDFFSNAPLAFRVLSGTDDGGLLIRLGIITVLAVPIALFILAITYLFTSRLDKPQPTKKQRVDTLRKTVNQVGSKIEKVGLSKSKKYAQFERLVKLADYPWGLSAREWFVLLIAVGVLVSLIVILQFFFDVMVRKTNSFPLFTFMVSPFAAVGVLLLHIRSKAKKRESVIQYDFMRAFNRLGDLNKETSHRMLEISLAGTRILKNYTPRVDLFKHNPVAAMEEFASRVGTDEAILFKNTLLYIMNNPENKESQITRAEIGIQKARSADEQKELKKLEVGFNSFILGPFSICIGVLCLPWYQFLKQELGKLIGW